MTPLQTRRALLRAACGGAALLAAGTLLRPVRAQDAPPAGEPFATLDLDWADARRQRAVPVRLFMPHRAASGSPVPLVVFSHGIGGSRTGYGYLGRHWAAHGVAALHLQHTGSDQAVWRGNPLEMAARLNGAATDAEATARVEDLRFALDTLLAGEHGARIDAARIAAAGHSYGANTAVLAAGAEVPREGRVVRLRDERVRAAMLISTPPFYGDSDWRRILAPVRVPTLHVTSTGDRIRIPGLGSGPGDRLALFEATGGPAKWLAVFEGGSHGMFTGRQLEPAVRAALQDLALAFTRQVLGLDGGATALAEWPRRHAAVLARFSAAA